MGGWGPEQVARVKSVKLPTKIKCAGCQAERPITGFSESQMARLRKKLATQGQVALTRHAARCLHCTGGALPTEITCSRCQKTKPLEAFTKTQRVDWDLATCKTCTAYYMTSETWEEERENAIASGNADGYTEIASTIDESVDGGVLLACAEMFPVASSKSSSRGHLPLRNHGKVQNGLWLGEGSVNDVEGDNDASTDITPSSAAKFSGWDLPALRAEESRPVSANGADGKQKNWARVKSADPHRNARILKMSDPMRYLNDQEDKAMTEVSYHTMVGAKDRSNLHKEMRTDESVTTGDDDVSTVKAGDA